MPPYKKEFFNDDQIIPRALLAAVLLAATAVAAAPGHPGQRRDPKLTAAVDNALQDAQKAATPSDYQDRRRRPSPRPRPSRPHPTLTIT